MIPKEYKRLAEVDFFDCGGEQACRAGEIDSAWASVDAPCLVGEAAVRGTVSGTGLRPIDRRAGPTHFP